MQRPAVTYPAAFGHWHLHGGSLQCRLPRKTVEVSAPAALLAAVARLCDGRLAWRDVAAQLARQWSHEHVEEFLHGLHREGALVESSELLAHWMDLGQPPASFPQLADAQEVARLPLGAHEQFCERAGETAHRLPAAADALARLLRERASQRTFGEAPIAAGHVRSLLWAAAGVTSALGEKQWHRTIASGGNMHGTRWFAAVLQPLPQPHAEPLAPGLYEARFPTAGGCVLQPCSDDAQAGWRTLLDPRILQFASAVLVPVAQLARATRKYGNRAALFAPVEAGQSLQNVQLMAAALGLAGSVQGHVAADAVHRLVAPRLGEGPLLPLPVYVAGSRPSAAQAQRQQADSWLQLRPSASSHATGSGAARFAWTAGPVSACGIDVYTVGRSADPALAVVKAEAEAWERLAWLQPIAWRAARMKDMPHAIDPRTLAVYSERQYRDPRFPYRPFHPLRRYLWVEGRRVRDGAVVHGPAECVHAAPALPPKQAGHLLTSTTTSGVAAWTDPERALQQATLELVERQGFLQTWLTRDAAPRIETTTLPAAAARRIRSLEQSGWHAHAVQLPSEFAAVLGVWIQREAPPFALMTAAAAFDPEEAIGKALDEAEGHAARADAGVQPGRLRAADVQTPADVARYWRQPRAWRHAGMFTGGTSVPFARIASPCSDWAALLRAFEARSLDLLAFDITPDGAAIHQGRTPLHVMRAIVPGWPAIWFRHGTEPAGLACVRAALARGGWQGRALPPHPFS